MKKGNSKDLDRRERAMKHEDRSKTFDFVDKDAVLDIEATTEYPVMYGALGTEPGTEHPFNVYRIAVKLGEKGRLVLDEGRWIH